MLSLDQRQALRLQREREHRFIQVARTHYRNIKDREIYYPEVVKGSAEQFARDKYEEGRQVLRILSASWDEFYGYLRSLYEFTCWFGETGYYQRCRRLFCGDYWYRRHGYPQFREGLGYRRQPHHEKKPKDDSPRASWREEKRFNHDKSKGKGWRLDKARSGKIMVARKNRRWSKQRIAAEDYDAISQNVKDICRVWWD